MGAFMVLFLGCWTSSAEPPSAPKTTGGGDSGDTKTMRLCPELGGGHRGYFHNPTAVFGRMADGHAPSEYVGCLMHLSGLVRSMDALLAEVSCGLDNPCYVGPVVGTGWEPPTTIAHERVQLVETHGQGRELVLVFRRVTIADFEKALASGKLTEVEVEVMGEFFSPSPE